MTTLEARIKQEARDLGFELAGIAAASPADGFDRLRKWLDAALAGEMAYMYRHREARRHPASILPEVRSVVMVAMNYHVADGERQGQRHGALSRASGNGSNNR